MMATCEPDLQRTVEQMRRNERIAELKRRIADLEEELSWKRDEELEDGSPAYDWPELTRLETLIFEAEEELEPLVEETAPEDLWWAGVRGFLRWY